MEHCNYSKSCLCFLQLRYQQIFPVITGISFMNGINKCHYSVSNSIIVFTFFYRCYLKLISKVLKMGVKILQDLFK